VRRELHGGLILVLVGHDTADKVLHGAAGLDVAVKFAASEDPVEGNGYVGEGDKGDTPRDGALGGAVVGSKELIKDIRYFTRHTGPSMSPFNAWVLSKSLETLALRMDKHCLNAMELAKVLESNNQIAKVKYPFLPSHPQNKLAQKQMKLGGGIVTFELKGGLEQGRQFLDSLKMISHTPNLGDSRTIAVHPASTTHSKLTEDERLAVGITPGLIRIAVGLENIEDITTDVRQAIK
jgi:O-succinylhomoserine sulfhydrylase